jgi:hypothetical protein
MRPVFQSLLAVLLLGGCASHSQRDFIPNGAGVNLAPTNPDHIQVLESVPRGMIIGTVLVDRSKAKNTEEIIAQARQKAAAVGGDFIVWEDSLGTLAPAETPAPGAAPTPSNAGSLGHGGSIMDEPPPEQTAEKTPKARFTVGIYLPEGRSH